MSEREAEHTSSLKEPSLAMLTGRPTEYISRAFCEAFADYAVPVAMTPGKLDEMMKIRGCDLSLSPGAFEGDRLVGFLLVGSREREGLKSWYDVATGVVPRWRGRGVARALVREAKRRMPAAGAARFLLEVLEENAPAVSLYRSEGFSVSRRLRCWYLARQEVPPAVRASTGWDQREFGPQLNETAWNSFRPSWQNSLAAWKAAPESHQVEILRDRAGLMIGYGIIHTDSGSILQLGSRDIPGRESIVRDLLDRLATRTSAPTVSLLNVEEGAWLNGRLAEYGFENRVNQYEMLLEGAPR